MSPSKFAVTVGAVVAIAAQPLAAQTQNDSTTTAPVTTLTGTSHTALMRLGVLTVVTTAALMPLDPAIARSMHSAAARGGNVGNSTANVFNWLGDPGTVIAPVGMIVVGWAAHRHPLLDVGVQAAEAVAVSGAVSGIIKAAAGRTRPTPGGTDSDDFAFATGLSGEKHTSFPSGHSTASFALATALTMGTAEYAPRYTKVVGITTYGLATTVALARLYTNHHWASDVVLGAGIGTFTGLEIARYAMRRKLAQATRTSALTHLIPSGIAPAPNGAIAMTWGGSF